MLSLRTSIHPPSDQALAWWVKTTLDGFALGCAPMWRAWGLPPLYSGRVRYQLEPGHGSGQEEFAMPPTVFARGWGDCDDLIVARLTELLAQELPPSGPSGLPSHQALQRLRARMGQGKLPATRAKGIGGSIHVLIRWPDGREEDPSIILGAP